MTSFAEECVAEGLSIYEDGSQYFHLKAVIAKCLSLGSINEARVDKKVSGIMQFAKIEISRLTKANGGGKPRRATLETIMTKVFPLLVSKYPTLRYYIDLWHRDHPQDDSTLRTREDRSASPDLPRSPSTVLGLTNVIFHNF